MTDTTSTPQSDIALREVVAELVTKTAQITNEVTLHRRWNEQMAVETAASTARELEGFHTKVDDTQKLILGFVAELRSAIDYMKAPPEVEESIGYRLYVIQNQLDFVQRVLLERFPDSQPDEPPAGGGSGGGPVYHLAE